MDIIVCNGHIRTMDEHRPLASAVGIKDGLIECVGDDSDILARKTTGSRVIDAEGRLVIPGLNDSHLHLLGYAAAKSGVDLNGAKSAREITARVREYIDQHNLPDGVPVIGRGFNDNLFTDKGFPTKADLDAASQSHPIYLARVCGHLAVVNSLMLEISGIGKDTMIDGGEILKGADGQPSGVLTESAMDLAQINKMPYTADQLKGLINLVAPEFAQMGITSVQTDDFADMFPRDCVIAAYAAMAYERRLSLRVTQKRRAPTFGDCRDVLALSAPHDISSLFRLGPVKLFADGSLGGRTALMLEDYHDQPGSKGVAIHTKEALFALVALTHKSGGDLAVHAIGDGAISQTLDAIEAAQKSQPRKTARHGIVHAQITTPDLLDRFKDLGVFAYVQPIFLRADAPIAAARVGPKKAAGSYAFKTLMRMGVPVPMGTDCPVEPLDPFDNIYHAVTRKGMDGRPLNPDQALTVEEAVRAYTSHGAYASHEEHFKGKLTPGYAADLAILSKNIFECPAEDIPGTFAFLTMMGGRIVGQYSRLN